MMTLAERSLERITNQVFIEQIRNTLRENDYKAVELYTVIDWPRVSINTVNHAPAARLGLRFPSEAERDLFIANENLAGVGWIPTERAVEIWAHNVERFLTQLRDRNLRILGYRDGPSLN